VLLSLQGGVLVGNLEGQVSGRVRGTTLRPPFHSSTLFWAGEARSGCWNPGGAEATAAGSRYLWLCTSTFRAPLN
jgi:hypothetical protein